MTRKAQLGSHIDRHQHIGQGYIGLDGFRRILTHPQLRSKAFILETPVDQDGDEQRNLDTLKSLCRKASNDQNQYDHNQIELKWEQRWNSDPALYAADPASSAPKYYVVEMLPYPSGRLHMGHVRNYSIGDALARYMWMRGYNVQHPMGWDAFGLPAENAAIKRGMHPRDWTISNIAEMKRQMHRMGFAYDWNLEIATCEPEYYKWNQWFFLKMFERGLAYRKKAMVNWCPECATVLANEQVVDGCCWRHETTPVEQRALEQWFWKITDYAEELLRDTYEKLEGGWPERVLSMQRNWIGRSEGSEIDFALEGGSEKIRVFTTRVDTIYGATCLILAPEHPLAQKLLDDAGRAKARQMIDARKQMGPGDIVKDGAFTGHYAINPYSGEKIPIWIGNFVLIDYGTGAIMAVPAHDERDFDFAKTFGIAIRPVIRPVDGVLDADPTGRVHRRRRHRKHRRVFGSPERGSSPQDERLRRAEGLRQGRHHLSHQGLGHLAPALLGHADSDDPLPEVRRGPVPEKDLPVILPYDVKFTGKGRSPLAEVASFMNVKCPQCGADAQRESDTMDTFVDSSWYFYRYCDPKNDAAPFDSAKVKQVVSDRSIHRRRHPRDSAFDLFALLHESHARSGDDRERRARHESVHAGNGAGRRRLGDVEIQRQCGRSRRDGGQVRRRYLPPVRAVRQCSRKGHAVDRIERRRPAQVRRTHLPFRDAESGPRRRGRCRGRQESAAQTAPDHSEGHGRFQQSLALQHVDRGADGVAQHSQRRRRELVASGAGSDPAGAGAADRAVRSLSGRGIVGAARPHRSGVPPAVAGIRSALAKEDAADVVLQVNGKVRGRLSVPFGTPQAEIEKLALADPKVQPFIAGKQVVKIIVVPDKLVNIVVR